MRVKASISVLFYANLVYENLDVVNPYKLNVSREFRSIKPRNNKKRNEDFSRDEAKGTLLFYAFAMR